jgi:electron transport complex protein RnfC
MREQAAGIMDGVRIMLHALKTGQGSPVRALIAVEANKPEAIASLLAARREIPEITIAKVPTRYPMGSEKHLVTALSGQETPAQARSTDLGMLVHNVGTAYAIHQAVRYGRPLISRLVTVSGGAVQEPQNLEVPIGTLVSDLLRHCGGVREPPARLLMGGPMMGQILNHAEVPVVKGSNGILALTAREVASTAPAPCIRCARCVAVCACGLMPLEIAARIRADDLEGAASYGLLDCIGCGSCAYVCPSRMPLVQYFQFAKGELLAREQARHKARETRRLAEQRSLRLAREAQTKKALPPKPVRNRTESAPATP